MTGVLFELTFYLALPFWVLLILVPRWSWTPKVLASPWVTLLPLAVYLVVALPHFGELWRVVSQPELGPLREFLGQPYGAAVIWAHLVAFDLFLGRWMYFEGRAIGLPTVLVSAILLLTIFLSPFGLIAFLAARGVRLALTGRAARQPRPAQPARA
ncbi:MAG TPA: ABA4-like family protein [Pseudonocardia sp.]|jgi:hypothetical protein|nr:ABA4-like family protein [Pseudonocardia sp.]